MKTAIKSVAVALASILSLASVAIAQNFQGAANPSPQIVPLKASAKLNAQVVNYAISCIGKQVGNGECWTLAAEALDAAGAMPAEQFSFGHELKKKEAWLPGDIIQFKACKFEVHYANGYSVEEMGFPNHTAIIYSTDGSRVTLLHQNYRMIRLVQVSTIDMNTMTDGSYKVFRPDPRNSQ